MALAANEAADFSRYFLVVEKFMKSTYNLLAHSSKRKAKFAEMEIGILKEGEITGEEIDEKQYIDQHCELGPRSHRNEAAAHRRTRACDAHTPCRRCD